LAESAVVVVAVERDDTPTVLTVRVPSRALHLAPSVRRASRPRTWHWLHPATWSWILPRAHLQVDLLLPSADADRQVEVNLPDGVSFDPSRPLPTRAEMEIQVKPPPPLQHLGQLMHQLLDAPRDWPPPLYQCLADLAGVMAEAARESLRYHKVGSPSGQASSTADQAPSASAVRARLDELRAKLSQLSASGDAAEPAASLEPVWCGGDWLLSPPLRRRTSADALSPRAVVARAGMVEDVSKRGAPEDAKIHVYVAVTDAEYFSIARFSGWMSALLMTVVLFFLLYEKLFRVGSEPVSPEVLAIVLTLFSAIQAGRIERSDRSTIRGLLALAGNKLIVASVLPTVILAVALAFSRTGTWPIAWAGGCICLQLLLQSLLRLRLLRALRPGSRRTSGSQPQSGLTLHTDPPDYTHSEVIHSSWWRSTTADALMIGCQAYGYVVWQRGASPALRELLIDARPASPPPYLKPASHSRTVRDRWIRWLAELAADTPPGVSGKGSLVSTGTLPADPDGGPGPGADDATSARTAMLDNPPNVLALQRSGTVGQSLTFVVFREQPKADWVTSDHVFPVDIDPDQLSPVDDVTGTVEIFLGLPRAAGLLKVADHPVIAILAAAEHRLHVLEVQLPVPAPYAEYSGRQWARVQMALGESDIEHLAAFLSAVNQRIAASRQFQPQNGQPDDRCIVGVKTISEGTPRIINPGPALRPASSGLVLASDIDVITASGSHSCESEEAPTWRVLAICADARSGIENDIVRNLGQELRVAALTYALLHGKAVILLLGHQPGERTCQVNLRDMFVSDGKGANFQVLLDEWQSRKDLGAAGPDPLLRVHIRSPDRPGATFDVLESLRETLQTLAPGSLGPSDWNVWYARTEVTAGNASLLLLTVRLSVDPQLVRNWRPTDLERIERRVRTLAARKAAAAADILNDDLGAQAQKDTVISVKLITVPSLNVS
jgi:hypothetical protein